MGNSWTSNGWGYLFSLHVAVAEWFIGSLDPWSGYQPGRWWKPMLEPPKVGETQTHTIYFYNHLHPKKKNLQTMGPECMQNTARNLFFQFFWHVKSRTFNGFICHLLEEDRGLADGIEWGTGRPFQLLRKLCQGLFQTWQRRPDPSPVNGHQKDMSDGQASFMPSKRFRSSLQGLLDGVDKRSYV